MSATPQFGGTNGVTELDAGQPGSALYIANDARFYIKVIEGPDEATKVDQAVVQQNVAFEDRLGFSGSRVAWEGILKVDAEATRAAIVSQLNRYKHGSSRTSGVLDPPDPRQMRATKLTNAFGTVLSEKAVLEDFSMGELFTLHGGGAYTLIHPKVRIVFKKLG